jgi:hypothetical protein
MRYVQLSVAATEYTEWHSNGPFLANIVMEKLAQAVEGVGVARPPPLTISTITYKTVVYAPAERADIILLFLLYPYMYSVVAAAYIDHEQKEFTLSTRLELSGLRPRGPKVRLVAQEKFVVSRLQEMVALRRPSVRFWYTHTHAFTKTSHPMPSSRSFFIEYVQSV